jgi:Alanine racemase
MDQFMVDVTHIEQVMQGDIVTLIGQDKEEHITVEELAEISKRFNYEFVCDLGKRIPRIYLKDGKIVEQIDYFKS